MLDLVLDKPAVARLLRALAHVNGREAIRAGALYSKIMGSWGHKPDRSYVNLRLTDNEADWLHDRHLVEKVVKSAKWKATYTSSRDPNKEVTIYTTERPPKRRAFRVAGGRRKLVRTKLVKLNYKESNMARTKKRSTKAAKNSQPDDIEGLAELEELEDLDELEEEEPEAVEEDEEEEKPKRKRTRKRKAKKAPEPELEEDEDEEDEEDEEEEPTPKRKRRAKAKGKRTPPPTRELPANKVGVDAVAKIAKTDARAVRVFLRKMDGAEKFKTEGRWAFTSKQANQIAKRVKAAASD